MGQVKVKIKIVNQYDLLKAQEKVIKQDEIRLTELEALVDTGAMGLYLPISVIEKLGLRIIDKRVIRTANGSVIRRVFADAWITILGRSIPFPIVELPDDCPPLIGVTVLQELDLVPNTTKEVLEPNPEHGGEWTSYAY